MRNLLSVGSHWRRFQDVQFMTNAVTTCRRHISDLVTGTLIASVLSSHHSLLMQFHLNPHYADPSRHSTYGDIGACFGISHLKAAPSACQAGVQYVGHAPGGRCRGISRRGGLRWDIFTWRLMRSRGDHLQRAPFCILLQLLCRSSQSCHYIG